MSQDPEGFQDWQEQMQRNWQEVLSGMNEQVADAVEQNVEAQNAFVQTWLESVAEASEGIEFADAMEGYRGAYETWMGAAEEAIDTLADADEGELSVKRFRDIWLAAANDSFKEVTSTAAFAAATGEALDDLLRLKQQRDEATEAAIHDFGLPTRTDLQEVGERLVELERRQHDVARRLDRVLDALEE